MPHDGPTVLDLFSGCGGMSWGLHKAGFRILGAIDSWTAALRTFEVNHPSAFIHDGDIRDLDPESLPEKMGLAGDSLDVLIGGPPCQGFSKNVPAAYRFLEDERNQLFHDYLRFVEVLNPRVVVMENVAEVFAAYGGRVRTEIVESLIALGYRVSVQVLTASRFGIPQRRRRVFFIASRGGKTPVFPTSTHGDAAATANLFDSGLPLVSAWEAIRDLPTPSRTPDEKPIPYTMAPQTDFQRWARAECSGVTNHWVRPLKPLQQARYDSLLPGQGIKDLPQSIRPRSGYSGAYGRLDKQMVGPTITRWVFHPGSGRFGHPVEPRLITLREAARIQSFTDDFAFVGSYNEIAGQIGNAVPPLLMYRLAPELLRLMPDKARLIP